MGTCGLMVIGNGAVIAMCGLPAIGSPSALDTLTLSRSGFSARGQEAGLSCIALGQGRRWCA